MTHFTPTSCAVDEEVRPSRASGVAHPLASPHDVARWRHESPRPVLVGPLDNLTQPGPCEIPAGTVALRVAYVPLVGRIAAGTPIHAEQSMEDIFPLPRQLVGEGSLLLLLVSGNSMIDAGISDGDWVVVREQPAAENREIVAAMVEGDATVKTFQRSDGHVWLLPANPDYEPIPGDDATIIGKVVALLRRL